jgi:hypothetical protein
VNVEHSIEGLRVGVAEHDDAPTGCNELVVDAWRMCVPKSVAATIE